MGDNDIEGRRAVRAGWCRSWQTGGWWIISCLSPGRGCTTDSLGQSRVINHLQKNRNWGLRRESSVLTSETKLVLLPPHQQLVSPCPAMCPEHPKLHLCSTLCRESWMDFAVPGICPQSHVCSVPGTVSGSTAATYYFSVFCSEAGSCLLFIVVPVSWAAEGKPEQGPQCLPLSLRCCLGPGWGQCPCTAGSVPAVGTCPPSLPSSSSCDFCWLIWLSVEPGCKSPMLVTAVQPRARAGAGIG